MKVELELSADEAKLARIVLGKVLEDGEDYLQAEDHEDGCPVNDGEEDVTTCSCEQFAHFVAEQVALDRVFDAVKRLTER